MKLTRAAIVLFVVIVIGLTLPALGRAQPGNSGRLNVQSRHKLLNSGRYREAIPILIRHSAQPPLCGGLQQPGYCL